MHKRQIGEQLGPRYDSDDFAVWVCFLNNLQKGSK
jgi:hypothetical protein